MTNEGDIPSDELPYCRISAAAWNLHIYTRCMWAMHPIYFIQAWAYQSRHHIWVCSRSKQKACCANPGEACRRSNVRSSANTRESFVNVTKIIQILKSERFTLSLSLEAQGPQLSKNVREAISCTNQGITSPKTGVGPSYEEKTVFNKLKFTSTKVWV